MKPGTSKHTSLRYTTRIYDELHGYIGLTELESHIIDTPIFQRLRRIKQLSAAWLVYPGALHTRFSHSIGVMHVMGIIAEKLARDGYIPGDDIQLLRIAALLHDIGHYPYSHTLEAYYLKIDGPSHEQLARHIILRDPDLSDVISSSSIDPWEIISIIEGRHKEPVYNMLLGSDLDADRADYLPRDALHTGVTYGVIDLHRIIDTLTVGEDGALAVSYKGLHAVENFYVARMHMYKSVYYHKTIIGYEALLRLIVENLVEELEDDEVEKLKPHWIYKAIEKGEYPYWEDYWVHHILYKALKSRTVSEDTKRLIRLFLDRRGFKNILDLSHMSNNPMSEEDREKLAEIHEELSKRLPSRAIIVFADSIPIVKEDEAVRIVTPKGSMEWITSPNIDTIVNRLHRYYIVMRVYVDPIYANLAREYIKKAI